MHAAPCEHLRPDGRRERWTEEGGRGKCKEGSRVEDGSQKRLEEAWKRGTQVVFCVPVCSFSLYAFLSFTPGNLYP